LLGTILAISFTVAVLHALSYVEGRHRWGIEPLLLLLAAQGACVASGSVARAFRVIARTLQPRKARSTAV
jgi:hypothetical protein